MLIAILLGLILYMGMGHATALSPDFDRAEANVKKDVRDEARRKQALEIFSQMKSATTDFIKGREKSAKGVNDALARRDVTEAELHAVGAPFLAEDKQVRDRLLDLQFQLRKVLTAEEWAAAYPAPSKQ